MKKHVIFILLLSCLCFSCSKFLDLTPKNKVVVYSLEDVKTEMASYLYTMSCHPNNKIWYRDDKVIFPMSVSVYSSMSMYADDVDMTKFLTEYVVLGKYESIYYQNVKWEGADWASTYWYNCYVNIGLLNTILKDLSNAPEGDEVWRERISGEAKMFRAYHIFKLLQLYAPYKDDKLGIPLNLDPNTIEATGRLTQTEVYRILIKELTEVLEYTTKPDEAWNVMYNKDLIHALLAQVYWYKAMSGAAGADDWKNAEIHSAEVMETHDLVNTEDAYRQIFTPTQSAVYVKNNPHVLFMFAFTGSGKFSEGIWGSIDDGTENVQYPSTDLIQQYDRNDIRLGAFYSIYEENGTNYQYVDKYRYASNTDDAVILFRIEDMYLINAEAKARQQDLSGAKTALENFKKAKIQGYTTFSGNSIDEVLNEILSERRKEFCFENDQRWLDMKRLNLAVSRKGKDEKGVTVTYSLEAGDYHYALPIPVDSEITYNPIDQNPGWGNIK